VTQQHVFISYSRADAEIMQRVKDTFNAEGIDVWTDTGIVYGTPNWQVAIEKAIENSACVVCILTPDAKGSRWVREELVYATFYEKPVYMIHASGDSKSVAILGFTVAQEVDVRDDKLFEPRMGQLIERIKNHVNSKLKTQEEPKLRSDVVKTQGIPDADAILNYKSPAENTETQEILLTSIPPDEKHWLVVSRGKEYTAQSNYDINDTFVTIGRAENNRIFVNDPAVSREHLQLIYTADGFMARDLGSTNGSYINAERINMRNIKPGDTLQVGLNITFVYHRSKR
jgi:hypothetical protein